MKSEKKLLITGGSGFISSVVILHIINNTNYSVINVDKLTYASNFMEKWLNGWWTNIKNSQNLI